MVTIRDIAKEAGVSASTASRAMNNNPHISQATIAKVKKIADQMGYLPDYNAKNLTTGEASAVGVIFPVGGNGTPGNPFYVNVLSGINRELIKRGYALSVAITNSLDDLKANIKSMVYQSKIKRFILLYSQKDDPIAKFFRENDLRFVVIGQPIAKTDYYVDNDNIRVGEVATQYLLDQKKAKKVVFVRSKSNWIFEQQRFTGFERIMNDRGLTFQTLDVDPQDLPAIQDRIDQFKDVDGVIATDDLNAMNFFDTFSKRFPKQHIDLIGFNNSLPHILFDHNFNTIDLFPEEMGSKAALLLFSDREDKLTDEKRHLSVGYKIIDID